MNHIRNPNDLTMSRCKRTLGNEFYFKDTEHALLNAVHGHITPCPACIDVLIDLLKHNKKEE